MVKYYARFERFGTFGKVLEVPSTNPDDIRNLINSVDSAYKFYFFNQEVEIVNGREVMKEKTNVSDWYYIGKPLTLEDVQNLYPNETEAISRMKEAKCDAVLTNDGHILPLLRNAKIFTP